LQSFNLTLANLDLDGGSIVDAFGRGKDRGHGTAQKVRSSTAVFLTFVAGPKAKRSELLEEDIRHALFQWPQN